MDSSDKYLLGKNTKITYETLQSNLWTIEDIQHRINMNGAEKPIATADLNSFIDKQNKNKQIIIEANSKILLNEEENGESVQYISILPQQSLQDFRSNQ